VDDNHRDWQVGLILLEREVAIDGYKRVEIGCGAA
jgi:hypothetical protein